MYYYLLGFANEEYITTVIGIYSSETRAEEAKIYYIEHHNDIYHGFQIESRELNFI